MSAMFLITHFLSHYKPSYFMILPELKFRKTVYMAFGDILINQK